MVMKPVLWTLPDSIQPGRSLVVSGRAVRLAAPSDEEWVEGEPLADPLRCVEALKQQGPPADVLTFCRPLPETQVCYAFRAEWENAAIVTIGAFSQWWEGLPQETRKNVRRAQRRGVTVQLVELDEALVRGISAIYNETPIRQGRRFPHYGKPLERVLAENASYLERSVLLGAFFNGQLIGFIKFVLVNRVARIMQIVALEAHSDKRPTNALLAKAVEVCCERRATHFVYGRYVYGRKENSPVTEFKRRNGFARLNYPRYYVPLTAWGRLALRLGLHRPLSAWMPEGLTNLYLSARAGFYRRAVRGALPAAAEPEAGTEDKPAP